jgi:hypothetical protein
MSSICFCGRAALPGSRLCDRCGASVATERQPRLDRHESDPIDVLVCPLCHRKYPDGKPGARCLTEKDHGAGRERCEGRLSRIA